MELAIWTLRGLYLLSLAAVCGCLAPRSLRALTKRVQPRDLTYLLFWGLSVNRIWFLIRGARFMVIDQPYEGSTLAACYIFAIALEAMVLVVWRWDQRGVRS